jgi:hypothetical protein
VFLIIAYVFSSTKLEKRSEQVLPRSKGCRVEWEGVDDTGYGQPKCTGDTQEIPRQQK